MNSSLELRDLIKESISATGYSVYSNEAPENATYPYVVCEVTQSTADDIKVGILEVNVWDLYHTFSRVDSILDDVEEKLKEHFYKNTGASFRCFLGDRQHVPDEDKSIKRVREKFMIRFY